jgi:hypothetical protein
MSDGYGDEPSMRGANHRGMIGVAIQYSAYPDRKIGILRMTHWNHR